MTQIWILISIYIKLPVIFFNPFSQTTVLHLIRSKDEIVQQYMARLINAFASFAEGKCRSAVPLGLRVIIPVMSHTAV